MVFHSRRNSLAMAVLALVIGAAGQAEAALVTSLVGDKDGFGLSGAPAVPVDGTLWQTDLGGVFFADYRDAGDLLNAPFTDLWAGDSAISYTHNYSLGGETPTLATLSVQFAGVADDRGPWDVFFNGTLVGQIPTDTSVNNFEKIRLLSFNIPVALLTGSDSILLNINVPSPSDGYSINFSELQITSTAAVPEPSSLASGLIGLLFAGGAWWNHRGRRA